METLGVTLKDSEQSYFQELFASCDPENQGKASSAKTAELFRCSQVQPEILERIAELCGARRLGHFGRSQFYVALKLIAAVQAGLPLKPEVFFSGIDIPLPKFVRELQQPPLPSTIQYEILKRSTDSIPGGGAGGDDSPASSPSSSPKERVHWTSFHNDDAASSDHDHLLANDESSERHSSDEEDVWTISVEQDLYYRAQFASMQPDSSKKISGHVAKEFFEKSKLPVHQLSKIWQLSDVDKDGALGLSEFCTAMHLVVLRRNNIELPDLLPPSLVPTMPSASTTAKTTRSNKGKASPPHDQMSPQNKEWTKFVESPNNSASQQSSPGAKPVSFDFSAASVEQDPQILHPVALRLTPDQQPHNEVADGDAPLRNHHHEEPAVVVEAPALSLLPKKEAPPPPPPRPKRNHARSSSLDLNRLGKSDPSFLHCSPPAVPPRISPSAAGAFEVYRKPASSSLSLDIDCNSRDVLDALLRMDDKRRHPSAPPAASELGILPRGDRRQLQASIRAHREKNALLSHMNSELSQELSEVMSERIALEIHLEHMKPLSYG